LEKNDRGKTIAALVNWHNTNNKAKFAWIIINCTIGKLSENIIFK